VDAGTLSAEAARYGWRTYVVRSGGQGDYLARLTREGKEDAE
jgi:hypothetical protein